MATSKTFLTQPKLVAERDAEAASRLVHDEASDLLRSFAEPRMTLDERYAAGKAMRLRTPRASHAEHVVRKDRPDPVELLQVQNRSRVQRLVPLRFARMLASPFSFLRGSAAVMASDLAAGRTSGIRVQACGDMHAANFGLFASAERNLVFAINDFDETYPGPWEWDLKRLAASAAVATFFLGGDRADAEGSARAAVKGYRKHMRGYAEMGHLETWYSRIDERDILNALSPKARRAAMQVFDKARRRNHLQVLGKVTEKVDGHTRIVETPPTIAREMQGADGVPVAVALDIVMQAFVESMTWDRRHLLSRYRIVDVARKVVGVGSVGTECWIILLEGADSDDPLFLQVKEAQPSVLAPYVDVTMPYANQGRRVVVGQRLTQGSPDIFLGWGSQAGRDFYMRQLADMKGGFDISPGKMTVNGMLEYGALCGWALALAHAKSGDAAMIAGYAGNSEALDEAIGKFALAYAKQTEQDHAALTAAARSGRIEVAPAV